MNIFQCKNLLLAEMDFKIDDFEAEFCLLLIGLMLVNHSHPDDKGLAHMVEQFFLLLPSHRGTSFTILEPTMKEASKLVHRMYEEFNATRN